MAWPKEQSFQVGHYYSTVTVGRRFHLYNYSRLPITRTFKGNRKKVRVIGSSSYRELEENSREYGK